ncbi:MAG: hypothetical protein JXB17_13035, partial [Bacteroidales bacterium]|nr:hypothetical protein [Bacteroidales bacterium]
MNKSLKNKIIFILQVLFSIVFIMNGYPQAGKAKLKINSNRKYGMIQGGTVKLKADMVLTE